MASKPPDVKAVFGRALEIQSPSKRAAYLNEACGARADLRTEVEELLEAHEKAGSFLAGPALEPQATIECTPVTEAPGTVIGRYKLLQEIGQGAFGVVYMAEQREPVQRKVALKIIKPGMDTKQVIARFEAERQALALMEHPNVARVLDAGATDAGRPYFVMELVKGVPITEYCDRNELSTRARLELFVAVCQAVQHAHQKGIIHRDLKPSNIMVTLRDGKPVPKVIDFGISKAITQRLTEKTLFTAYGQMVGTPQYMSPEQAEMSELDVDTRSDIYSLGVLLYELLTGTTPLESERLRAAGFAEMQRIICEEDTPKPSVRLSSADEQQLTVIAKHRSSDPKRLQQQIRGELDWIVMKSLEKERGRRYDSASAFAADIQRHLGDQPIEARPPSTSYRMRKFVRRNKGPVAAALAVAVALMAGFVGASVGWMRAWQVAVQLRQTTDELCDLLKDNVLAAAMGGQQKTTEELLDQARRAGVSESWREMVLGILALYSGGRDGAKNAVKRLEHAIELDDQNVAARALLVRAALEAGRDDWITRTFELEDYEPKTPEDYLFLAFPRALIDREEGLELIDRAVELRNLPLARAVRAELLVHYVLDTGEWEYAAKALEDIRAARPYLRDNPFVLGVGLDVRHAAIHVAQGNEQRERDLHREAREVIVELEESPDYFPGHVAKAWYFQEFGSDGEAREAWEKAVQAGAAGPFRRQFAIFLYGKGELQRVASLLDRDRIFDRIIWEVVRAETSGQREEAIESLRKMAAQANDTYVLQASLAFLHFLGAGEHAKEVGQRQLEPLPPLKRGDGGWVSRLARLPQLEFLAHPNKESEEKLLKTGNGKRYHLCMAHGIIALKLLGEGNRSAAKKHLQASVENGTFDTAAYQWSRAFLQRLEDPRWPPWIPVDEQSP